MMGRENQNRHVARIKGLLCLLAGTVLMTSTPAMADDGIALREVGSDPAQIERSWGERAMDEARPLDPPSPLVDRWAEPATASVRSDSAFLSSGPFFPEDASASPYRLHGRIFFRFQGNNFSCSGTLISSRQRNVVLTAGHCVWIRGAGGTADWAEDLVFVPGYDGNAPVTDPYGVFPATNLAVRNEFRAGLNYGVDFAFFTVDGAPQEALGARRIAFELDPAGRSETIFGYPALPSPPYDGRSLVGCDTTVLGRDPAAGIPVPLKAGPCNMGSGASGGGWVTDTGYVNSLTSYGYCAGSGPGCGAIYGPYLAGQARSLYSSEGIGGSVAPRTSITTERPASRSASIRITLQGIGSTPLSYRCSLDGARFRTCPRVKTIRGLRRGRHILRVVAVDQTGHRGPVASSVFRLS